MDGEIEPASAPPPGRGVLLPPEIGLLLGQAFEQLPLDQMRALRAYLAGFNHVEVAKLYGSWVGPFPEIEDPPPDEPESF